MNLPESGTFPAPGSSLPGEETGRRASIAVRVENGISVALLCAMALLPILEILGRKLWRTGIPGSAPLLQHGTLWIGFLGGALSARDGRMLALGTADLLPERVRERVSFLTASVAAAAAVLLCAAGTALLRVEWEDGRHVLPWLPAWAAVAAIPGGFALVAWRTVRNVPGSAWRKAASGAIAAALSLLVAYGGMERTGVLVLSILVLLLAVAFGAPLFSGLGGLAVLLFSHSGVPLGAIPAEMYRLVTSPTLPTLPLFTFAGYLLTAGNASGRLVRFFRALVGWAPGGVALVAVLTCAFFTTFTGASGVTILALGGILLPALLSERYPERFSVGLITASGSLGMLFPPCLPVILYAVVAGIGIDRMFLGGILPGTLLVLATAAYTVRGGIVSRANRTPFSFREMVAAGWDAKWDLALPFVVLAGIFGGFATTVEAAAITVLYAFAVEAFVHRTFSLRRDLPRKGTSSATLIGGVLIILAAAMGLTSWMVDAGAAERAADWVRGNIQSKVVFLLALNLFLIVVGCLMDIFSAIVVVVPVIVPMAEFFGIDPVHLGVIFLANLQLGFLTPPVGMNLFLSAYRFHRSLGEVARSSFPFFLILLAGVLAITYLPFLSKALLP